MKEPSYIKKSMNFKILPSPSLELEHYRAYFYNYKLLCYLISNPL